MYFRTMSDEEFLRYAESTRNAITSTELELEFMSRMGALLDNEEGSIQVSGEFEESPEDVRLLLESLTLDCATTAKLLDAVSEAGIENVETLTQKLTLAKQAEDFIASAT